MALLLPTAEAIVKLPDFHWTLERYHAAIAAGVLTSDDKVELLFGKLVPISPVGIAHGKVVNKISRLIFSRVTAEECTVGVQNPITLLDNSEPEPDLYIASGPLESYDHHPYSVDLLLVIEVSDSTLARNRTVKLASYAVAEIQEYWIVNVYEKQVERYTRPVAENGTYETREVFKIGDRFLSLHLGEFTVEELVVE